MLKSSREWGKKNRRLNMGKKVFLIGLLVVLFAAPVYADDIIYVSNAGDKTLSMISTDTDTIVGTIAIGTKGSWPSNQWNGNYIAFNTKKGVDIVSLTGEMVSSLDFKSKKNWQDFTPDSKLLVVSSRDVDISSFVDMDESSENFGKVIAQVQWPKGFGICDATISSDGKYMYIPGIFSDKFGVLDIKNKKVLATLDIPRINESAKVQPFMTTVSWDAKYVFMENKNEATESVIDVSDPANPKEIVRFVPEDRLELAKAALEPKGITVKKLPGAWPQSNEFTLDNKYTFIILMKSASVAVVDVANMEVVKEITLTEGGKPRAGDFSPDGSKFYVSGPSKNVVDVIDVATLTKVKTIKGFNKPQGVIGAQLTAAHAVDAIGAVRADLADTEGELHGLEESVADTEKELHGLEESVKSVKETADAAKAEGKGVCGPTALLALAMLPLGIRRLLKKD